MSFDAAAVTSLFAQAQSHLMTLGLFESVNSHEPKNAPGNGLHVSIWVQAIMPVGRVSGMGATSGRVELRVRVYSSMLAEPQDGIDPEILSSVTTVMSEYSGNFTLGGTVRNVDLLGANGPALSAQAGYITISNKMFRVMEVVLPVIINDLYQQEG